MIFLCAQFSVKTLLKFPAVDCTQITGLQSNRELLDSALVEYTQQQQLEARGKDVSYAGNVQCFCTEKKQLGHPKDQGYGLQHLQICEEYINSTLNVLVIKNSITIIIVVINYIIREISIRLIIWIGYDTYSEQLTKITNGVFIGQFFNTAFLLLLAYANFSDIDLPLMENFTGPFNDYTDKWYALVGSQIVSTMTINMVLPPAVEAYPIIEGWFCRRRDQGWEKDRVARFYKTKKTQIYSYMDLYQGYEYFIHFKYSIILNTAFVTMLYGFGMPILFPIAAVSYFILWATERYVMAYVY